MYTKRNIIEMSKAAIEVVKMNCELYYRSNSDYSEFQIMMKVYSLIDAEVIELENFMSRSKIIRLCNM